MWFLFALLTSLAWGSADLFYKKGSDSKDPFSHLKIVVMVGLVMGIHGTAYLLIEGLSFDPFDMIRYLPVSALYILSMAIGYFGLRYIELSIASPVQNSSGAVTAILLYLFFPHDLGWMDIAGVAIITFGVVGLETAVALLLTALVPDPISPSRLVDLMSRQPARVLGLPGGSLSPGSPGDVTLIDPRQEWSIDPAQFRSQGRNTPFAGWRVRGRVV